MKTTINKFFSLIELCIAIGVLAVGATAVVTLVPVGINQKKSAIGENYAAIFANDTQSYFSSKANENFSELEAIPKTPNFTTNVVKGASEGNDLYKAKNSQTNADVEGVYIISKSRGGIEDYAGQVVVWQTPTERKITTTSYKVENIIPDPPAVFDITSGTVSNTKAADLKMSVLGSELTNSSGDHGAVSFAITVTKPGDKNVKLTYPFSSNSNKVLTTGMEWPGLTNLPAGTTITATASVPSNVNTGNPQKTFKSNVDTQNILVLKHGDSIPPYSPMFGQKSAAKLVKDYVSADGKTMDYSNLGADKNKTFIFLVDVNTSNKDFQDLVVLAKISSSDVYDITPISTIGINPTNSDNNYAFDMLNSSGAKLLDIDMMKDISQGQPTTPAYTEAQFLEPKYVSFSANSLTMRTKNGDDAKINIGGQSLDISGKLVQMNASEPNSLKLKIWKKNGGNGQWQIVILSSSKGTISLAETNASLAPEGAKTVTEIKTPQVVQGVVVNVEISWPLSQPDYNKREKVRYNTEYYGEPE